MMDEARAHMWKKPQLAKFAQLRFSNEIEGPGLYYSRPINHSTIRMITITPKMPLGP